ncbi:MAG: sn-glycerol-1-phosphate dehydrogenase, partial [Candidatus Dormibacteraceae bacterium]
AGAVERTGEVFARLFDDQPAVVVADEHTWEIAGRDVERSLSGSARELADRFVLPGRPALHADYRHVEALVTALRRHRAIPVAVGSGTINDLVKRASHEVRRRYLCVGTAASMDGYTSFGASITKDGYKRTMSCPAPRAVLADRRILRTAPATMTSSGYGDLLGKVTAGADWMIADELQVEPIDAAVWDRVQGSLRGALGRPGELHAGGEAALDGLIEGLLLSGLAMQAARSSRPASGAEHQFSHLWEMEGLGEGDEPPLSHGFKVGVGSIAIAALYERMLARDLRQLDTDALVEAWPTWQAVEAEIRRSITLPGVADQAVEQSRAKYAEPALLRRRLDRLRDRWPILRRRLQDQLLPAAELRRMLGQAGCPVGPEAIGLDRGRFHDAYRRARMIRGRYTVLDLAAETGILEACVEELFGEGGFWRQDGGRDVERWSIEEQGGGARG